MFCVDKSLPFWRVLINDKDTHCLRFWSCIHTLERVSTWSFGETVLRWSHGWLNNSIIDAYGCHLFSIVLIELCICFWILLSVPRTIEITNRPPPEPLDQVKPQHIRPIYGIGRRPFFIMWVDPPSISSRRKKIVLLSQAHRAPVLLQLVVTYQRKVRHFRPVRLRPSAIAPPLAVPSPPLLPLAASLARASSTSASRSHHRYCRRQHLRHGSPHLGVVVPCSNGTVTWQQRHQHLVARLATIGNTRLRR
jgi:hypothetical protein